MWEVHKVMMSNDKYKKWEELPERWVAVPSELSPAKFELTFFASLVPFHHMGSGLSNTLMLFITTSILLSLCAIPLPSGHSLY